MSPCFELPEECNVYHAEETQTALREWVERNPPSAQAPLEISAARVAEIDGTALQLLASLSRAGFPWKLTGASNAFTNACDRMGLSDWVMEQANEQV